MCCELLVKNMSARFLQRISCFKQNLRGIKTCTALQHWNKDYLPGPCPKTDEEKAAAAKKYGIPLEEYRTYPDDGSGYGMLIIKLK